MEDKQNTVQMEDSGSEISNHDIIDQKTIQHDGDIFTTENEELIFNPYNEGNVEITLSEVQSILTRYGVPGTVHNLNLYKRAFIHRSYTKRPFLENQENNIQVVYTVKPLEGDTDVIKPILEIND